VDIRIPRRPDPRLRIRRRPDHRRRRIRIDIRRRRIPPPAPPRRSFDPLVQGAAAAGAGELPTSVRQFASHLRRTLDNFEGHLTLALPTTFAPLTATRLEYEQVADLTNKIKTSG
jgi:hypothetical protein